MREKEVTVLNKSGLHARPSALISKTANQFASEVSIIHEDANATINAKSIIGVMTLGASQYTILKIRTQGDDEEDALFAIYNLFENKFDEP